jgi:hypothetical protein
MSPLERKRGRRLVRALRNMELALVDQVGAFQRAQIDYLMADIRTPYGTRIADDLEIAVDYLGELRTRVRESREHLRAALAVRGETPRLLAWSTAQEDYTTNPRDVLDNLEPVDDEWLERFSQAAERKRTPAEPAFAWELDGDATGAPNRSATVIGYTGSWRSPDGAAPDDAPDLESDEPRPTRAVGAIRTRPYDAPRQKPAPVTVRFESRQIEKLAA